MSLKALRSAGERGTTISLHAGRTEPLRVLDSSGSGVAVRRGHKGASRLDCNAHPARAGGGVTGGRLRANNTVSNRRAPGLQRRKASRLLRVRLPSRGGAWVRVSVDSVGTKGVSSPSITPSRRPWGARAASEKGNLQPPRHAASHARRGEVLCSRRLGPHSPSSSFQPVASATDSGVAAPPASGVTKSGDLRRSTYRRACSAGRRALSGLMWLAARSSRKGWAGRMPCSSQGAHGKRGQTRRAHGSKRAGRSRRARIGRSGSVLARRCRNVAEVDERRRTQRSVRSSFHPIRERTGTGV